MIVLLVALATGPQAHIAKESCHGKANRCRQRKTRGKKREKERKRWEKRWSTAGVEPKSSPVSRGARDLLARKTLGGVLHPEG